MVVQPKWETPMKLKGKAQADPTGAAPDVVEQTDPEPDPVADPEPDPVVGPEPDPVSPVSPPGQEASQYPQAPTPETWLLFASVWVEHQGVVSPSMVVHPEWRTPIKLKGKAQADPAAGPSLVMQLAPEAVPVTAPEPDPDPVI